MWPEVICPEDGQPLVSTQNEMMCSRGHHWSTHLGIPRMTAQANNYAEAFGLQWKVYRKNAIGIIHENNDLTESSASLLRGAVLAIAAPPPKVRCSRGGLRCREIYGSTACCEGFCDFGRFE